MAADVAWKWLSARPNGVLAALTALQVHDPDAVAQCKTLTSSEIPGAIRCVVLVMELAFVSGSAFLLLLITSVMARGLQHAFLTAFEVSSMPEDAVVQICETATFGWGLVTLMSWFFRQPKRDLMQRLTMFGWSGMKTCSISVMLHVAAVIMLVLLQPQTEAQVFVSWRNIETVMYRSDGSLATAEITQQLLLAPLKEELFFRGAIQLVAINRLQNAKSSALISAVLFAAIHLANARHLETQYSASYVAFQVLWAFLVGFYLALALAVSGSVVKCLLLHVINNVFALGVSKTSAVDVAQPFVAFSMLFALAMYSFAISRQLQLFAAETGRKRS
ncbi:hypothetical protein KXD40_003431 [Peronospora effusa]|uniref:CAAX prenyl protease 2/Lysostaphin resistance protein A-like domain-containing protein n=1 Tax=Peronospora effusa TaxID=542832 RepID=A0A3M6VGS0_9STRA|nr:hypothetical protein DD238_005764 [Peronospora effusa]RQM15851.1 hypothetical protein DD237_005862 [Peronospora effusa]UIZ22882.1 hypothetical protein KXD40_003431 [Peronospora effusa]CAI5724750.1 unnamed protein product [Peronospora effusa]